MKKIVLLAIATIISFSCKQKSTNQKSLEIMTEQKTYLALGDSYTIGESVLEKDRFPVILVNELKAKGFHYVQPKIIAKTGWTTDELEAAIAKEHITKKFDLVTLLIGVNNQYRGRSVEEFRVQFINLLETALGFANNKPQNVIVVSIPDWSVSPFAKERDTAKIASEIDAFNAIKKEETLKRGVLFVDITPTSRKAKNNATYIAEDGLHFSGNMHQLWVQEIIHSKFK
jgi:lysophospholipase L1-like esterase